MISQTLRDARRYEDAMAQNITPLERPEFHLSPKVGWMNDPNGFLIIKTNFIYFTSIIHMMPSGDQCTGDMQ